jgi:tetratricopeptide (TPR) repeat protein
VPSVFSVVQKRLPQANFPCISLWFNFCNISAMKVAVSNITTFPAARELEKEGEFQKAVAMYKKLLRTPSTALPALTRMMMIYRKLKKYDDEIDAINKAISIHEQHYRSLRPRDNKASLLSRKLNQALGLSDKKGKSFYKPEEVLKLEKRKAIVLKK